MGEPWEVKLAIVLSWGALVIGTGERLWRISVSDFANTFVRLRLTWTAETLSSALLVAIFIYFASRRHNWGRIGLLVCTLSGWFLWYIWTRTVTEYAGWQWVVLASVTAMELLALILLFFGKGAAWYRSATGR
jgi:hypothetical protein